VAAISATRSRDRLCRIRPTTPTLSNSSEPLMLDAARLHRTDGGLVRLITPIVTDAVRATEDAAAFGAALMPYLSRCLP
jgi:hypothetical protein